MGGGYTIYILQGKQHPQANILNFIKRQINYYSWLTRQKIKLLWELGRRNQFGFDVNFTVIDNSFIRRFNFCASARKGAAASTINYKFHLGTFIDLGT